MRRMHEARRAPTVRRAVLRQCGNDKGAGSDLIRAVIDSPYRKSSELILLPLPFRFPCRCRLRRHDLARPYSSEGCSPTVWE